MKKYFSIILLCLSVILSLASVSVAAQSFVQRPGDLRTPAQFQRDCAAGIAVDSCRAAPRPRGCPVGQHWSLEGTGLAHCVENDPVCSPGSTVTHDSLGNPSCTATVCANGNVDFPACVTPPSCANGFLDYPACVTPPACANSATNYPACNTFPSCANGANNYPACNTFPSCANGNTDYPTCIEPPICANGANDYPTCVRFVSCLNGATDYPTCLLTPSCPNGALDFPSCSTFPQRRCSESHRYCDRDISSGGTGDPRDTWYNFGTVVYSGPTCEPELYQQGMNSEWDGACMVRGVNYSEGPASGSNYAD